MFYNKKFDLNIKETGKYVIIYHTDMQEYPHIRIDKNTLDVYSASGKVSKGKSRKTCLRVNLSCHAT
jgi:hypothetical protein